MFQEISGCLYEQPTGGLVLDSKPLNAQLQAISNIGVGSSGYTGYWPYPCFPQTNVYWNSYPVYVCTDKTKKAIDILKALQADKQLECKSVAKFIELVEKIAGIL